MRFPIKTGRLIAMALLPLLVLSCDRPESDESYLKVSHRDDQGKYCFTLKMDDPQYLYDVDVYISSSADRRHYLPFSEDVLVEWTAPSGAKFEETVSFSSETEAQKTFFSKVYLYHYRAELVPVEYGDWALSLKFPSDFEENNHANGIGIRLIRNGSR